MSLEALIQSEELHRYKTALEKIVSVNVLPKVEVGSYLQTIARDALNRDAPNPDRREGSKHPHAFWSMTMTKHPKCEGYRVETPNGTEYDCGYDTTITCEECRYCAMNNGRGKDPAAKCNQQK